MMWKAKDVVGKQDESSRGAVTAQRTWRNSAGADSVASLWLVVCFSWAPLPYQTGTRCGNHCPCLSFSFPRMDRTNCWHSSSKPRTHLRMSLLTQPPVRYTNVQQIKSLADIIHFVMFILNLETGEAEGGQHQIWTYDVTVTWYSMCPLLLKFSMMSREEDKYPTLTLNMEACQRRDKYPSSPPTLSTVDCEYKKWA